MTRSLDFFLLLADISKCEIFPVNCVEVFRTVTHKEGKKAAPLPRET